MKSFKVLEYKQTYLKKKKKPKVLFKRKTEIVAGQNSNINISS